MGQALLRPDAGAPPVRAAAPVAAPRPVPVAPPTPFQVPQTSPGPIRSNPLPAAPGAAAPAPATGVKIDPNAWQNDPTYKGELTTLGQQWKNTLSDNTLAQSQYNTNYNDSLKRLGWSGANPDGTGQWNFSDLNTAAGRGFNNEQNDYAGRGLLQSTLYKQALDDFTRSLNQQQGQMATSKGSYMDNLAHQLAQSQTQNDEAVQAARAAAISRMSNQLITGQITG